MVPHTDKILKMTYFGPTLSVGNQMVPYTGRIVRSEFSACNSWHHFDIDRIAVAYGMGNLIKLGGICGPLPFTGPL